MAALSFRLDYGLCGLEITRCLYKPPLLGPTSHAAVQLGHAADRLHDFCPIFGLTFVVGLPSYTAPRITGSPVTDPRFYAVAPSGT